MLSPFFDQDLRLTQTVKDLAIEELFAEPSVEAFTISVFPRAARFDVRRLCAYNFDPILDGLGNELRSVTPPE